MISEAVAKELDTKEKSNSSKLSRKSAEIEGTFEIRINSNDDKAYTSKTSCINGDVLAVQIKSKSNQKPTA